MPTPDISHLRYNGWRRHVKRMIDIVVVLISAPLTLPVGLALAVVVKVSSRGPVLFRHERVGHRGEPITVLKFRTMHVDAEARLRSDKELYERYVANDYKLSVDEDPRLARCGRFLRSTSLDELPQLLNVLAGSMTVVGPRPVVWEELETGYGPWKQAYLCLRPGITGRWQTSGRNQLRYPGRAEEDARYLMEWSVAEDLRIIAKTIPAVLRRHGVH